MRTIREAVKQDLEDWQLVERFLPQDWEAMARSAGALRRRGKFRDAPSLLRTLLLHLAAGCSLKETALRARLGGLAEVSAVAVWKRLREAGISVNLTKHPPIPSECSLLGGAGGGGVRTAWRRWLSSRGWLGPVSSGGEWLGKTGAS